MTQFNVDSVDKQIDENMSSEQIAGVLDHLLFQALKPVLFETDLVECVLASIINPIYSDHRRKFSTLPKADLVNLVFGVLTTPTKQNKWELILKSRLERSVWFQIIDLFHKRCRTYHRLEHRFMKAKDDKRLKLSGKMHIIEVGLNANRARLSAALRWSQHYFELYNKFKGSIVNKYVRLAQQETSKAMKNTKLNIDKKALFNNLTLSIGKAIDKFDPAHGTLTNYVNLWFMNAKTNPQFDHEEGKSYDVSTTKRRKMSAEYANGISSDSNLSVSIDEIMEQSDGAPTIEAMMVDKERRSDLFALVNRAPRTRVTRLLLNVPYKLNAEEMALFDQVAV